MSNDINYSTQNGLVVSISSMLHGACDKGYVNSRKAALEAGVAASLHFAINSGGVLKEKESIKLVAEVFEDVKSRYMDAAEAGQIKGASSGGFNRGR